MSGPNVRRWLTGLLVVLTALAVVVALLALWAHDTVFDTDTFMETTEPAFDDPSFYAALSERVSGEALVALDLDGRVADRLDGIDDYLSEALLDALGVGDRERRLLDRVDRPTLRSLAPDIAAALEARVESILETFVASDVFRTRFPELVRSAHRGAIALVRDDPAELTLAYIEEGEVRLDLMPVIVDVLRRVTSELRDFLPNVTLPDSVANAMSERAADRVDDARRQLAEALGTRLADDFGQVTITTEQSLADIQATADRLDRYRWAAVLLAAVLAILTMAASPARLRTAIHLALGVLVGLVLGWMAMRRLQDAIVEQVVSVNERQAVQALLAEVASSFRTAALVIGVVAVVVAVAAYLAGRPAWVAAVPQRRG